MYKKNHFHFSYNFLVSSAFYGFFVCFTEITRIGGHNYQKYKITHANSIQLHRRSTQFNSISNGT